MLKWLKEIRWRLWRKDKTRRLVELCKQISSISREILEAVSLPPTEDDSEEALRTELLGALFARALEHHDAVLSLASHGLAASARAVMRCLLEVSFYARALANGALSPGDLAAEHNRWRLKFLNKTRSQFSSELRSGLEVTEELRDEILQLLEGADEGRLSIEEVARRADASDEYLVAFEMLSATVHVTRRDLRRQFVRGKDGSVKLSVGSHPIDLEILRLSAKTILELAVVVAEFHGRDIFGEAARLMTELSRFSPRAQNE